MLKINRKITKVNRTVMDNKRNMWIVIHYVGSVSTAKNNATYFYSENRKASAHYFVDENEIWQVVEDKDAAWHVGATKYYNSCRNNNSIGIEMCCKKLNGMWYIEPQTIANTIALTRYLAKKYGVDTKYHICRHFDCTGKLCPEPMVRNEKLWIEFLKQVQVQEEKPMADFPEKTMTEKYEKVKQVANFDDGTIDYYKKYIYREPMADKLYLMAVDAEKWRNQAKN